jgi:hypothetical protein
MICIYRPRPTRPFHFQASLVHILQQVTILYGKSILSLKNIFSLQASFRFSAKDSGRNRVICPNYKRALHMHSTLNIYKEDKKARFERVLFGSGGCNPSTFPPQETQRSKQTCTCVNTRFIHIMDQITKDIKP